MQSISHYIFPVIIALSIATFGWPLRWLLSGAPLLTQSLILGEKYNSRVLSFVPLWVLVICLNFTYAIAATSWLFYGLFTFVCYPAILLCCLYQFDRVARVARNQLRGVLKQLHFINDKIAFFDIPALEIDTEVEGLLVVRGITFSLAHLGLIAHGVEVGIKLSEDIELALQVDEVKISLFRRIDVGDVYANLKGGEYEMTFGKLKSRATGDSLLVSDTPLLEAAAARGNTTRPDLARTTSKLTNGVEPTQVSFKTGLDSMTQISPDEGDEKYQKALRYIKKTSFIEQSIQRIEEQTRDDETKNLDEDKKALRAAVCSQLHDSPSVPHPPLRSVKVTTLQNLSSPRVKKFLHRLPFLLRLLLNPLSYFHPINIKSITAAGSGKWLEYMLQENVFKHYSEQNSGIRKLEKRISAWLTEANFVLELVDVRGNAQVPITPSFDIINQLKIGDVLAYRTLPASIELTQVVRLAGADTTISVPSFLLPHHEHLLPPVPDKDTVREQEKEVENADGKPQELHAKVALEQVLKDEATAKISVHATLPAVFDQELLDFVAAVVKAVKIIEMEKDPEIFDDSDAESVTSVSSSTKMKFRDAAKFKEAAIAFRDNVKGSMRKASVDAVMNDRWIAKLVGKVTKAMETVRGDLGYSGDIPIPLKPYRDLAETELKLLP